MAGRSIHDFSVTNIRARVGLVTQDVQLFHASVRDNITLFDTEVPDVRILEVMHKLGLSPWLWTLPNGLDTQLCTGSNSLSGGEAQLVSLARIFLKDPGLVILDEASSRLDPATEHVLQTAIAALLRTRTGIIIAHHLKTLEHVDNILILHHGSVQEFGSRAKLEADVHSRYYELLHAGHSEVCFEVAE